MVDQNVVGQVMSILSLCYFGGIFLVRVIFIDDREQTSAVGKLLKAHTAGFGVLASDGPVTGCCEDVPIRWSLFGILDHVVCHFIHHFLRF